MHVEIRRQPSFYDQLCGEAPFVSDEQWHQAYDDSPSIGSHHSVTYVPLTPLKIDKPSTSLSTKIYESPEMRCLSPWQASAIKQFNECLGWPKLEFDY